MHLAAEQIGSEEVNDCTMRTNVKIGKRVEAFAVNLIALATIAWFVFPLVWQLLSSIKPAVEVTANPPVFIFEPTLQNWQTLLFEKGGASYLLNSIIVAAGSAALSLVLGSIAAYGLARFDFRGRDSLALDFLSFRMFPPIVIVIPLFLIFSQTAIKNTYFGLILAHTTFNLPFTIWLLRGFFMEFPLEIEHASLVDGCTRLGFFRRILLPLSGPGLATSAVFSIILSWNEFMFSSVISSEETRTFPVFSASLMEHYVADWSQFAAAATVSVIPVLIVMLFAQKYMIKGLTYGAIQG
jgi:multiple sugar transport system permease protein